MKAGQYVKCVRSIGDHFLKDSIYEIIRTTPTNGSAVLRSEHGKEHRMFIGPGVQFEFIGEYHVPMTEPMFDLDDMELAEILIEEMK